MLLGVNIDHIAVLREARRVADPNLLDALGIVNTASMSKEELEIQDKREEFIFIQQNSIEKAKREGREEEKKRSLR